MAAGFRSAFHVLPSLGKDVSIRFPIYICVFWPCQLSDSGWPTLTSDGLHGFPAVHLVASLKSPHLRDGPLSPGSVLFNGVDVRHVPLTDLRDRMAVVPQAVNVTGWRDYAFIHRRYRRVAVHNLNWCAGSIHQQQYQYQSDSCYCRCFTRNLKCLEAWTDVWSYIAALQWLSSNIHNILVAGVFFILCFNCFGVVPNMSLTSPHCSCQ